MATQGQYWTEAERIYNEDKVFLLEQIALLYTITIAPWLENPCPELGKLHCLLTPGSHHLLFSLILVICINGLFYSCEYIFNTAGTTLEDFLQPIKVPWIQRILFWVEHLLMLVCYVMAPKGSIVFRLSVILNDVSLLANIAYFVFFLDRMSYLRWFILDNDDNDSDNDSDESDDISEDDEEGAQCRRNIKRKHRGQCEKSCETMLVNWDAKFEKLQNQWLRSMNDAVIETEKKLQTAEDANQEERRKWEEEKVQLAGKLSAAIASAELYRSLLHDSICFSED